MKTYYSPMLQVVSIKNNDIVTESLPYDTNAEYGLNTGEILAPGRRNVFDYYEGY